MSQETQTGAQYQPREVGWGGRWEGGSKVRGYTLATSCKELTHWKNSDAGRDLGQEQKGTPEDEMAE